MLIRIDDRLIHGQITCAWVDHLKAQRIIVVNDKVTKNPVMVKLLPLAAPLRPDVKVSAMTVTEAIDQLKSGIYENERVILILDNPRDVLTLVKGGVQLDWVDVGQQGHQEGEKRITRTVSVSPEEVEIYKEIANNGVRLLYWQVPSEPKSDFIEALKKHFPW